MGLDTMMDEWRAAKLYIIDEKLPKRIAAMAAHYITVSGGFSVRFGKDHNINWTRSGTLKEKENKQNLREYMRILTELFLDKADGAIYYMWNGTKDSSMVFDKWSYRYLAKPYVGFN